MRIGVVATSSPLGKVELQGGVDRMKRAGFDVVVHPNVLGRHFVNAGTDEQRASSLVEYAYDDSIDAIWCARGGYGAARTAGLVDAMAKNRPQPKPKMLIGYSDVTFLHEYVRQTWGWQTLHAPMVAASPGTSDEQWAAADAIVRGERPALGYEKNCLRWLGPAPAKDIAGDVIGGNLSLWVSLAGTPWQPQHRGKILFFEDIGEKLYRLDRMVVQLEQAGMIEGAAAIVLGDFTNCDDESPTMLGDDGVTRVPMRPTLTLQEGLLEIFGRVAKKFGIPLALGLPVGHGPSFWPLRLGAQHRLTVDGSLVLV
jgi:muramoyltetrapeptide carboxypeptidase